jgi:hypothetical protein
MTRKRGVLILFCFFLIFNMTAACFAENQVSDLTPGVANQDAEWIKNQTEKLPMNDDGTINQSKFIGWRSAAELRIEAMNLWLVDNASWLKVVFGMVPEISWLFALNIYFMLLFLAPALNGFPFFFVLKESLAKIASLALFVILVITKVPYAIARVIYVALTSLVGWFWSWGWIIGLILMILLIVAFILIAIYCPGVIVAAQKAWKARQLKKEMDKAQNDREALGAVVKGIEEGSK